MVQRAAEVDRGADWLTTTSDQIRKLASEGMAKAEIARTLGIRYQFVQRVLGPNATLGKRHSTKPQLNLDQIVTAGFAHVATWSKSAAGSLSLDRELTKKASVYAFAIEGRVLYVGLASMGLAQRIYYYIRPGASQATSKRLNQLVSEHLAKGDVVELYAALPPDGVWNGLPVDFCAGLELGLIRTFSLPWNKRSAG